MINIFSVVIEQTFAFLGTEFCLSSLYDWVSLEDSAQVLQIACFCILQNLQRRDSAYRTQVWPRASSVTLLQHGESE
jgi:hypothetical protein